MTFINLNEQKNVGNNETNEQFALDVLMGLSSKPKHIPPKYFYDAKGSELFQKITDSSDYYVTECEKEILVSNAHRIVNQIDVENINIVELGAGDGRKTKTLLEAFLNSGKKIRYVPVDISESAIRQLSEDLSKNWSQLEVMGIVSEYFQALRWLGEENKGRNFVMFLGSNIGNFNSPQASVFLRTMWNALNPGDFAFIGFDLKKDIDVMIRAYNDSDGVTEQFNLNLLNRMNDELGANFNREKFEHYGTYNVKLGAMESFLVSKEEQNVEIKSLNKTFHFKPYEPIHVEFSFKYLPQEVKQLLSDTGFRMVETYFDEKQYFMDALVEVVKATN